ncbi:MAG: T9SS type A sorting domain-containing protein [Paludibacter sp.]
MKKLLLPLFIFAFVALMNAQTAAPQATNATGGKLTVNFSMTNAGGSYGGQEVFAIYITDNANKLVNTLFYRTNNGSTDTGTVGPDLPKWWSLIGSAWPSSATRATKTQTLTDATTGATTSSYLTNQVAYWGNNTAAAAAVAAVADGTYTVNFEVANSSTSAGMKNYSKTFVKGTTPIVNSLVTATTGFSGISISWAPIVSGINEIQLSNLYSVYPNPTKSSVFVSGIDIKEIELCDLSGKRIFTSNEQKINLGNLPKGTYLAKITSEKGLFIKKIIKE